MAFPPFNPSTTYPLPGPINQLSFPYPTNSWAQNTLTDNLPGNEQIVAALPWYLTPHGTDNAFYFSSSKSVPRTTIINYGDLIVQDDPVHAIAVRGSNLQITNVDDLSLITTLNGITCYMMRGSPYATLLYDNTQVQLEWVIAQIGDFQALPVGGYYVDDTSLAVSTISERLLLENNLYQSQQLTLMDGFTQLNTEVLVTFTGTFLNVQVDSYDLTMDTANPHNTNLPSNVTLITAAPIFGFNIVIDANTSYTILYITTTQLATVSTNVRTPIRWYILTAANLNQNGNIIQTAAGFTGVVQLVCSGPVSEANDIFRDIMVNHAGTYAMTAITENYDYSTAAGNQVSMEYDIEFTKGGMGNILWWVPPHTLNYYQLNSASLLGQEIKTVQYGRLQLAELTSNPVVVLSRTVTLDDFPTASNLSPADRTKLAELIRVDAARINLNTNLSPNDYGQQAASIGRLIVLAQTLGIETETIITDLITTLRTSLEQWLNGTNSVNINPPNSYQLQIDTVWGGLVVPADDETDTGTGPTAQGNSYYNNHHYQYGYFYYALACLEQVGQGLYATYSSQIQYLLFDTVNPKIGGGPVGFSTKWRHKDAYGGHSWQTGVVPVFVRRQEAFGEAINCYFSAWLLAKHVGLTNVADISAVALITEIDANLTYMQYKPNTCNDVGILDKTAVAGEMLFWGKGYRTSFTIQPDSYNGKSLGMAGLQSVPFTEATFLYVKGDWVKRLGKTIDFYRIDSPLVIGLTDNEYTADDTYNQPITPFDPQVSGGYFGAIGLELLGVDCKCVTETEIIEMWFNLLEKQANSDISVIKQFDTFSNILYWLLQNCRMNDIGSGNFSIYLDKCGNVTTEPSLCAMQMDITLNRMNSDVHAWIVYPRPCPGKCSKVSNCCNKSYQPNYACTSDCSGCRGCDIGYYQCQSGNHKCKDPCDTSCNVGPTRLLGLPVGQAVEGCGSLYCKANEIGISAQSLLIYGVIRLTLAYLTYCRVCLCMLSPDQLDRLLCKMKKTVWYCYARYLEQTDLAVYFVCMRCCDI